MFKTTMTKLVFSVIRTRLIDGRPGGQAITVIQDVRRARQYNREKERLMLVGLVAGLIGSGIVVATGLPSRLRDRIQVRFGPGIVGDSLTALAYSLLGWLVSLPLSYYSSYVVEHRYGLSNHTRRSWFAEHLKTLAIGLVFEVPIANGVLSIIRKWPERWWAIVTAISVPFTVLLSQLAPVLIAPLFNRYEPLRDRDLANQLTSLADRSNVKVADVLQMDMSRQTSKANAFFTGIGTTKRIVVADTLLQQFGTPEIEVVVAHEIGHQAHRDIWRLIAAGTVFTAALSYSVNRVAKRVLDRYGDRIGVKRLDDIAALPLLSVLLSIAGALLTPVQNAYSRKIERRADDFALRLSNNPIAFERAMTGLASANLADPNPPALIKYAFYSHPPIAERIRQARGFQRKP